MEVPPKGIQLVGMVDGPAGVLHVTPLTTLQLMRPDMTHLDQAAASKGLEQSPRPNAGQPMKLQTQFRRRDPHNQKAADDYRRTTWAYHVSEEEKDSWVDMRVYSHESAEAVAVLGALRQTPVG